MMIVLLLGALLLLVSGRSRGTIFRLGAAAAEFRLATFLLGTRSAARMPQDNTIPHDSNDIRLVGPPPQFQ